MTHKTKSAVITLGFFFVFCFPAIHADQFTYLKIEKLKETTEGEKLYAQGKYDDAIRLFKEAISKGETRGEPYYYIGTIYELRHHYEESIPYFENALKNELQDEFREATLWKLILLNRQRKNYADTLTYIDALEDMGINHPNLKKFREEAENNLSPEKIKAHEIVKEARKIIFDWQDKHKDEEFWSAAGNESNQQDVLSKYRDAVSLDPQLSSLYWDIVSFYEKTGDTENALKTYDIIIEEKKSADAAYRAGVLEKKNGNFEKSRNYFKKALDHLDGQKEKEKLKYYLLVNLSEVLYALKEYDEGLKYSEEITRVSKNKAKFKIDDVLLCLHIAGTQNAKLLKHTCRQKINRKDLNDVDIRLAALYYFMEGEVYASLASEERANQEKSQENNEKQLHSYEKKGSNAYLHAFIPPSLRNAPLKTIRFKDAPEKYEDSTWSFVPFWCLVKLNTVLDFLNKAESYHELYLVLSLYDKYLNPDHSGEKLFIGGSTGGSSNYYSYLSNSAFHLNLEHQAKNAFLKIPARSLEQEKNLLTIMFRHKQWGNIQNEVLSYTENLRESDADQIRTFLNENKLMKRFPQIIKKKEFKAFLKEKEEEPEENPKNNNKTGDQDNDNKEESGKNTDESPLDQDAENTDKRTDKNQDGLPQNYPEHSDNQAPESNPK